MSEKNEVSADETVELSIMERLELLANKPIPEVENSAMAADLNDDDIVSELMASVGGKFSVKGASVPKMSGQQVLSLFAENETIDLSNVDGVMRAIVGMRRKDVKPSVIVEQLTELCLNDGKSAEQAAKDAAKLNGNAKPWHQRQCFQTAFGFEFNDDVKNSTAIMKAVLEAKPVAEVSKATEHKAAKTADTLAVIGFPGWAEYTEAFGRLNAATGSRQFTESAAEMVLKDAEEKLTDELLADAEEMSKDDIQAAETKIAETLEEMQERLKAQMLTEDEIESFGILASVKNDIVADFKAKCREVEKQHKLAFSSQRGRGHSRSLEDIVASMKRPIVTKS